MNEKKEEAKITFVDGIPCIDLDNKPILGPEDLPFVEFEVTFFSFPDFSSLQKEKEKEFLDKILKDLDEFFRGE